MKQRTVPAGVFKNSCLKLMEEVHQERISIIVTKRGKPIVQVVPIAEGGAKKGLRGTIVHQDEDIFSTGETWEADR
jgi:prevent-host-death family protein